MTCGFFCARTPARVGPAAPPIAMPPRPLIAVIGSGTTAPGEPPHDMARAVGAALAEAGCDLLNGGMAGVMAASAEGFARARETAPADSPAAGGRVIGLTPGGASAGNRWLDIVIPTGLGHLRNALIARAEAVVAIGGGAGTLSELALAWIHDRPIIGLRVGGWSEELAGRRLDDRERTGLGADDQIHPADDAAHVLRLLRGWKLVGR